VIFNLFRAIDQNKFATAKGNLSSHPEKWAAAGLPAAATFFLFIYTANLSAQAQPIIKKDYRLPKLNAPTYFQ
jgi:hypothetical protein